MHDQEFWQIRMKKKSAMCQAQVFATSAPQKSPTPPFLAVTLTFREIACARFTPKEFSSNLYLLPENVKLLIFFLHNECAS